MKVTPLWDYSSNAFSIRYLQDDTYGHCSRKAVVITVMARIVMSDPSIAFGDASRNRLENARPEIAAQACNNVPVKCLSAIHVVRTNSPWSQIGTHFEI